MPNLMDAMPLDPNWLDIAVRLALVTAAGALVGTNREIGGHAAGFRTTILVGLAACLTMIQANLLLSTLGKTPQSFASMDVLRFPLGVLTGVGFIGGGAILKRGDLVTGVTTAATLWIMTAVGLCIGGGQLAVGSAGAVIAFIVLSPLKWFDKLIPRRQKARFVIELPRDAGVAIADVQTALEPRGYAFAFIGKTMGPTEATAHISYEVRWMQAALDAGGAQLLTSLQEHHKIVSFEMLTTGW
ncbi:MULTISPECIES: MgtC/SapB family protein [unclassified Rhizobium]|uniref:MgtC/SapB family protein n=1 Tax=unclassified Rhizobium TaxID=2613769 RepID=UPI000EA8A624|nr:MULTISPECIES: MgtC/SapB family protein [unclassified Rhizobium]AYG69209.1 MgtC/SapB family protein [Rhizobium sp. CCGE531]AYG75589.1 MgtC/SapB family protein [Rhizobium sp. CCGE532]